MKDVAEIFPGREFAGEGTGRQGAASGGRSFSNKGETMLTPTVKWIIAVILVVDVALLCSFIRFRIKRSRSSSFFDFDRYKERELLRRHLLD